MDNVEVLQGTAKFVTAYGYLGVSLLLMGVAWMFYLKGATIPFWVTGSIGLSFLVIFAGLDFMIRTFPDVVIVRPPLLVGRVTGAPLDERVLLQADDDQRPFLKREFDPNDNSKSNHLFIFSRASGVACLELSLSTADAPDGEFYAIPLAGMPQPHRPDDELVISVQRSDKTARWMHGAQRLTEPVQARRVSDLSDECPATPAPPPQSAHSWLRSLVGAAYAQALGQPGQALLEERLGSEDPFVRRRARQTLAHEADAAPDTLVGLLRSPNEQSQLGGLATIAGLPPESKARLPSSVWSTVDGLAQSGSSAVRRAADGVRQGR